MRTATAAHSAAGVQTRRRSLAAACRQLTLLLLCRAALLLPLPLEDEEETMHDYSCAMLINQCSLLLWLFTELIFTALCTAVQCRSLQPGGFNLPEQSQCTLVRFHEFCPVQNPDW